ncbi:protein adenylyltransferase SelO [Cytobacillus horneckiae]|uniref:YdiU family protein n=1 Tax=Cytobacillus horneckiae TaxID=549687 RepID=UPI0034CF518D
MSNNAGWNFDNSYVKLPKSFYSSMNPNPVSAPKLVFFNDELAAALGLDSQLLQSEEGTGVFAGNIVPDGASPLAQAYGGHQFGHFNMLGDGRAVLLGEQITPEGKRVDVQLKGAGKTVFSRGGDGRAALGPMLREYIISEAMQALGIPTTRSLAVVTTGEAIIRETELPGAVLTRIAASHLRVGTFQYAAKWGKLEDLRALADYAIQRHYPEIEPDENRYLSFLEEVIERQAALVAKWQLVGFIHGVMNTDNMTISGETIDYGPCAFMDVYDSKTVFSSIDVQGRYSYGNQPYMAGWNLARFAESLIPLLHDNQEQAIELAQQKISAYMDIYQSYWRTGMRSKLGIFGEEAEDEAIMNDLLNLMAEFKADYTNTFRALTFNTLEGSDLFKSDEFSQWHKRWQERLDRQQEQKSEIDLLMKQSNPAVIPRNHRVEEALEAAVEHSDYSVMEHLLNVLSHPYAHSAEQEPFAKLPITTIPYQTYCGT